jgi:hypothetical protein
VKIIVLADTRSILPDLWFLSTGDKGVPVFDSFLSLVGLGYYVDSGTCSQGSKPVQVRR